MFRCSSINSKFFVGDVNALKHNKVFNNRPTGFDLNDAKKIVKKDVKLLCIRCDVRIIIKWIRTGVMCTLLSIRYLQYTNS